MANNTSLDILKLLWPVLLIQIGLQIYAVIDVLKNKKTKDLSVPNLDNCNFDWRNFGTDCYFPDWQIGGG